MAESEGKGAPAESGDAAGEQDVVEAEGDGGGTNSAREEAGDAVEAGDSGADSSDSDTSNSGSDD